MSTREQLLEERTAGWPPEQIAALKVELAAQLEAKRRRIYRSDPVRWSHDRARNILWSKQQEILRAVMVNTRVAVPACHGPGKTFTAADLVGWWLDVHEPGTAFVLSTAPTFRQVRAVLWREIGRLHRRAKLPGRVNQTEWHIGSELVGFGAKPADQDESAFQGLHSGRMLVILDEAGGVPDQLYAAAEAVAVGDNDRIVAFGNPDDPTGPFERICRPDSLWHTIHISAFDTPNLTGEPMEGGIPDGLVTRRYVEDARIQWGEDSPLWASKVLGEFPKVDEFSTVRPEDVAACRQGRDDLEPYLLMPIELGVDVGGGGDMTSIRARHGVKAGRKWEARTPEPEQVVTLVLDALVDTPGVTSIKVDATGIGWGICSDLRKELAAIGHLATVVPVNFAERAREPHRLKNVRAELWWDIGREFSKQRIWDLSEIDDTTAAQLMAPRWADDGAGRIVIEAKEDVIKRTGRSPDDADALLLAFYRPVAETTVDAPIGSIASGAAAAAAR